MFEIIFLLLKNKLQAVVFLVVMIPARMGAIFLRDFMNLKTAIFLFG